MNRVLQLRFFVAVVFCLLVGNSTAAVISVQPVVAGYFTTDFNPLPSPPQLAPGVPVVVQIDAMMEVLSLATNEDSIGTVAFTISGTPLPGSLGKAIPDVDAGGWDANNPIVDTNGAAPGGIQPLFYLNADIGISSQDYKGVLIQMPPPGPIPLTDPSDPRRDVGEVGSALGVPFRLGSAFFEWNRMGDVNLKLNPLEFNVKQTNGRFVEAQAAPSATLLLHVVPEPTSLVLLASCVAGLSFRRRVG